MLKRSVIIALCCALGTPVFATDAQSQAVARAIDQHILPGVSSFDAAASEIDTAARADCTAESVKPAYQAVFDAWMGIQHLHFGPIEAEGRTIAIAFWPDKKGMIPRTLSSLIDAEDPVVQDPDAFAQISIAARGLFALDYLLYDEAYSGYGPNDYTCGLVKAVAADMARIAGDIDTEWHDEGGFAHVLQTAGQAGNPIYLSEQEAIQALYTMLTTGLENTKTNRIGRPIGSFERPRPSRAEAYRSGRSVRNVALALEAAQDLARALAPGDLSETEAAFDLAFAQLSTLDDPAFQDVKDPAARLKAEIVAQTIETILGAIANDVGLPLSVAAGFNASDGD